MTHSDIQIITAGAEEIVINGVERDWLPADADENTLQAFYDDDDNVVVSVEKKAKEESGKASRSIPIGRADRD